MAKTDGVKFSQPGPAMRAVLDELLSQLPPIERRTMFGCPCTFVGGNMFAGLFGDSLFVRLAEPDRQRFLALPGTQRFGPRPDRPMKEYVLAPESMLEETQDFLPWIQAAYRYSQSLPPKAAKAKKPRQSK